MKKNQNLPIKLYSQNAINIATYIGGPLASGYLVRQNFINLGKDKYGLYSMIIGLISTILILIGIFSVPEHIISKIPNPLIPLFYTGIIYLLLDKLQGKDLKEHKANNGEFYSAWKATGIGVISMVILLSGVFGYILVSEVIESEKFDQKITVFYKNEEKALELYTFLETSPPQKAIDYIDSLGIPAWESNLEILTELDKIEGLYDHIINQNQILRTYCYLRIEQFKLIRKSLIENTNFYDFEIQRVIKQIDLEVEKLNH